ncbi:MAG: cupin domain-containing protein [Lachnospiraceae bacterium]|nr:cupin domain-containing protein [Lachnospiraceae bacterium]
MINFKWNEYDFSLIRFDKGIFYHDMVGHSHSKNSYELHYIVSGEGTLVTGDTSYPLAKGNFFVTGPNVYHKQLTNPNNPMIEIFIYLQASGEKTKDALVSAFLSTHFFFCREKELGRYFEEILVEGSSKRFGYKSAIGAMLQLLLIRITRLYVPHLNNIVEDNDNLNDRRFLIIEEAFINHPEGLTLGELSGLIGLCERQTQRLLQKYYGKSFTEKKEEALRRE